MEQRTLHLPDGTTGAIFGHPPDVLVWLANEAAQQQKQFTAGDIVTTGSCAPILQVLPGQRLTVSVASIGEAICLFD